MNKYILPDDLDYKLGAPSPMSNNEVTCIIRLTDGAVIPMHRSNEDYQQYLAWVEAGNTPKES